MGEIASTHHIASENNLYRQTKLKLKESLGVLDGSGVATDSFSQNDGGSRRLAVAELPVRILRVFSGIKSVTSKSLHRHVIQYGERFRNLIWLSALTVIGCAFLYGAGLAEDPAGTPLQYGPVIRQPVAAILIFTDALIYSAGTFVSPGFTDFTPRGDVGRFVATVESAAGIVSFALFIYIIGRRAGR
jgi:hypothetical protein